jgi:hypothetical protein
MVSSGWRRLSLILAVVGIAGLVGCSSGGDTSVAPTTSAPASQAPQAQPSSAADVATGLRKIDQLAKDIAASAGSDKTKATSLDSQIEPTWAAIEDTVKQNDQNTYLTMEDNFAVLEKAADDGDAAAATKGSAAISSAVQAYLAKYSG